MEKTKFNKWFLEIGERYTTKDGKVIECVEKESILTDCRKLCCMKNQCRVLACQPVFRKDRKDVFFKSAD